VHGFFFADIKLCFILNTKNNCYELTIIITNLPDTYRMTCHVCIDDVFDIVKVSMKLYKIINHAYMFFSLRNFCFFICFFLVYSTTHSQGWKNYPYTPEGSTITFPKDEGYHPEESIEWWYTAGHLVGDSTGVQYSYMLSYFYFPAYGYDGFRILNLSNEATEQFFSETVPVNYSILAIDSLYINASITGEITEIWTNKLDENDKIIPFEYILSAEAENGSIDLEYVSEKPPLILGDDGQFNQGADSYTYYFSLTKCNVIGSLTFNDVTESVTGTTWIDRQYGTFNPLTEEDYEWFYIQLSNDMDINIYNLFTKDRQLPDTATYKHMSVYVDTTTQYTTHNFEIDRLAFRFMPDSGMCYSQRWRLTSPQNNVDLIISTTHHNTEVPLPFRFFEGSTTITGTINGTPVTGIGFAELLHSYEKPELEITYPVGDNWTNSRNISWNTLNPDDGRPLKYDLEYSTDDKESFFIIASGLSESSFNWNDPSISAGSDCWFKVTAYSIDSTLINTIVSSNSSKYDPNLTAVDELLSDENNKTRFQIYPNPAKDVLYLDLADSASCKYYQILDICGRIIQSQEITSNKNIQIDLSNQRTGIYFLGLFSEEEMVVSKFFIQ
jgi:predicted secreted hydrolase